MRDIADAAIEGWAPYLIGIIVVSLILHVLTIRVIISQMRVLGDLSHDYDALAKELEEKG